MFTDAYLTGDIWPYHYSLLVENLREISGFKTKSFAKNIPDFYFDNKTIIIDEEEILKIIISHRGKISRFATILPSGRQEIIASTTKNGFIKKISHSDTKILYGLVLPIRYPFDIFTSYKYILKNYWDIIILNLKEKWNLKTIRTNVFAATDSIVDENCVFLGKAIIGPSCIVKNGVVIGDRVILSSNCQIEHYSKISRNSYIGNNTFIGHCAELGGIIEGEANIKHNSYFRGVMGINCNLGFGTACGTTRFDRSSTMHLINGRTLNNECAANEVYIGNSVSTGVNSVLLAGSIIGNGSIIGPNCCFKGKLPDKTLCYQETPLKKKLLP